MKQTETYQENKMSGKSQAPVKIYIWTTCPYCQRALSLLDSKGVDYEKIILDGKDKELNELRARTGQRTVPQIFIGEKMIGGYSDLSALDKMGDLDEMLGI